MSSNTGIVMQLNKNHACVMTSSGEFLKLKISKNPPKVGEVYTAQIVRDIPFYKYAITAATLTFIFLFSSTAYAYYTPVASVVVDINPSIKLDLNRWNRIIKTTPLNEDGKKVLSELKVQNKSLNDGLDSIVIQAKKDNFINGDKSNNANTVNIDIDSSKSISDFNISQFEEKAKSDNIKLNITKISNNKSSNSDQNEPKFKKTEKDNNTKGNGNNKATDSNKQNNNNNNVNSKDKNINLKESSKSNSRNKDNQNDNKQSKNNKDENESNQNNND